MSMNLRLTAGAVAEALPKRQSISTLEEVQAISKVRKSPALPRQFPVRQNMAECRDQGFDYIDADPRQPSTWAMPGGLKEGRESRGKYQDGVIYLNRNFAGAGTLARRIGPFMEMPVSSAAMTSPSSGRRSGSCRAGNSPRKSLPGRGSEDRLNGSSAQLGGF
jgi:hypothetical protein